MKRILWMVLGIMVCAMSLAQKPYPIEVNWEHASLHFGIEEGLPGKHVYSIIQDRDGFMWFGTDQGLARYDGLNFKTYTFADGLPDNDILGISEDSKGRLWLWTLTGIPGFYADGELHTAENTPFLKGVRSYAMQSAFTEDKFGNVYLGYYDGRIFRIDRNDHVDSLVTRNPYHRSLGMGILSDTCGYLVPNGLKIVVACNNKFYSSKMANDLRQGSNNFPVKVFGPDRLKRIIITSGRTVGIFSDSLGYSEYLDAILDGKIVGIFPRMDGRLVFSTTNGVFSFEDSTATRWPTFSPIDILTVYSVSDVADGTWFGTENGLFFMPASSVDVLNFRDKGFPISLVSWHHRNLLAGLDRIGVLEIGFHSNSGRIQPFAFEKATMLRHDREGIGWLNSARGIFHEENSTWKFLQSFEPRDFDFDTKRIGKGVFCTTRGLIPFDVSNRNKPYFGNEPAFQPAANDVACYCTKFDGNGDLWVAFSTGIARIRDNKKRTFPKLDQVIGNAKVKALQPLPNGGIAVGTQGNGLVVLYGDRVYAFNSKTGISNDFVSWLHLDNKNRLLIGGKSGLDIIQTDSLGIPSIIHASLFSALVQRDPIVSMGFDDDSTVIATANSIFVFPNSFLVDNSLRPRLVIERLLVNDSTVSLKSNLRFLHDQNTIQFEFVGISYLSGRNISFRYRLQGLESEWTYTKARFVRFPRLPPGEYTFQLQGKLPGQSWEPKAVEVSFVVLKPFWQEYWFIGLCVAVALLIASIIGYLIFRSYARRNQLLNRAIQAEQKALIAQMNPHFIFNSLNSIQYFYLKSDFELANEYLSDFSQLIRAILENGRKQWITIAKEMDVLRIYSKLERLRLHGKFDYEIDAENLNPSTFMIPPMILQPLIENSIWHGMAHSKNAGILSILFTGEGDCIVVVVEDNGIGREKAQANRLARSSKHTSLSTKIIHERLALLSQEYPGRVSLEFEDLYDEDGIATGTRVKLRLPKIPKPQNTDDKKEAQKKD